MPGTAGLGRAEEEPAVHREAFVITNNTDRCGGGGSRYYAEAGGKRVPTQVPNTYFYFTPHETKISTTNSFARALCEGDEGLSRLLTSRKSPSYLQAAFSPLEPPRGAGHGDTSPVPAPVPPRADPSRRQSPELSRNDGSSGGGEGRRDSPPGSDPPRRPPASPLPHRRGGRAPEGRGSQGRAQRGKRRIPGHPSGRPRRGAAGLEQWPGWGVPRGSAAAAPRAGPARDPPASMAAPPGCGRRRHSRPARPCAAAGATRHSRPMRAPLASGLRAD